MAKEIEEEVQDLSISNGAKKPTRKEQKKLTKRAGYENELKAMGSKVYGNDDTKEDQMQEGQVKTEAQLHLMEMLWTSR
uniref:Uncharacterized protein n=1 Tax=Ditylenchus dipsaci TaxID=166011 RepID=A0A915D328_9BILA